VNRAVRRVAVAVFVLLVALLVNANYVQVIDAGSLRNNPHNTEHIIAEYDRQRGPILAGGFELARSVPTSGTFKYARRYPGGAEYAPITGFDSLVFGSTGLEAAENSVLSGQQDQLSVSRFTDLLTGRQPPGGAVVTTINRYAQQAAWAGLQGKQGAAVALNPRTGAILALVTTPSFDPEALSRTDTTADVAAYHRLLAAGGAPLTDRAISERYPPGSTFKIIDLAAALSSGRYTPQSVIPAPTLLRLPQTSTYMHNYAGEVCGNGHTDTISDAFRISCDTAFADLGYHLGAARLARFARRFGVGQPLSIPLPVATSYFPANANAPETALSAIGQFDVAFTPLQDAMLSAAIANGGVLMKPYLVAKTEGPNLATISTTRPQVLDRAVSPSVARTIKQLMELVVQSGTGTTAQIPGVLVAGKTGTAEHGAGTLPPDAWFTAFAPANNPRVAVGVFVENGAGNTNATGAVEAGPIAKAVIEAVLNH
jgi:peptidoglycan glycosyltransferase